MHKVWQSARFGRVVGGASSLLGQTLRVGNACALRLRNETLLLTQMLRYRVGNACALRLQNENRKFF